MQKRYRFPFLFFLILFVLSLLLLFVNNQTFGDPVYKEEGTRYAANKIIIDEHYSLVSTSNTSALLVRSEDSSTSTYDKKFASRVYELNWNETFIIFSNKKNLTSNSDLTYSILNKKTEQMVHYKTIEAFEQAKEDKQIDAELKSRRAFDWHT